MNIIDKIVSNFINNKSLYIGEKVTMSEHMIQSAMISENFKSSSNLICSCLLHDYGHFFLENPDILVSEYLDGKHVDIGYEYLRIFFKDSIGFKFKLIFSINFIEYLPSPHPMSAAVILDMEASFFMM